jgi:SAM-dependent methyltransferase
MPDVIADDWLADTQVSYDTVAASYAVQARAALAAEPYLKAALVLLADMVRAAGGGPVADVGCGPGHATALLRELGVDAFGIDLSPAMIDVARQDHPGLRFEVGSMTDLRLADASVAALLAFWSLIHVPDNAIPTVFGRFRRVLRPGGPLLLGFHAGDGSRLKTAAKPVTPSPSARTVPATSRPGTNGGWGSPGRSLYSPWRRKTSMSPTAACVTSMAISPGPGTGSGRPTTLSTVGSPNWAA